MEQIIKTIDPRVELQNRIDRLVNDIIFTREHKHEYLNYKPEDGQKNWAAYEKFTIGYTSLNIRWGLKEPISVDHINEPDRIKDLYRYTLKWMFALVRGFRLFPARFFRQSSLVHGSLSLHAETDRILTSLYYFFNELYPIDKFEPYQVFQHEIFFLKPENGQQRYDTLIFWLLQQSWFLQKMIQVFVNHLADDCSEQRTELEKMVIHCDVQKIYLLEELQKIWEFKPDLKSSWNINHTPIFHFLEKFVDFNHLIQSLNRYDANLITQFKTEFDDFCEIQGLGKRDQIELDVRSSFTLANEDRKGYSKLLSTIMQEYRGNVDALINDFGEKNDELIRQAYGKLQKRHPYKEHFETSVYEYYTQEADKVQWHLQDVKNFCKGLKGIELSKNDLALCDIIKEIAYCEGYSYSIGYQNMHHIGMQHPFALWNVQQCHEELKHYHAIRAMLQSMDIHTHDLDEEFLAATFNEPKPEAYHDQYSLFVINFLGETHNIRAYLLLADAFDNPEVHKVLRWVAEDEVVHKKVFAAHFKYLCATDPTWERNTYECLMDYALGVHQAGECDRYHVMMKKIGKYYASSGKTTALEFLNMSMRAQYLELKALFSPEVFKISEFDFRQKHLRAYVF